MSRAPIEAGPTSRFIDCWHSPKSTHNKAESNTRPGCRIDMNAATGVLDLFC